ncbi:BTAD domain-containing putative transcriptional regulator [Rhizohabitans arisaemae]|uniref:BTAD domain-containing putative transcriptional regulator n=1 Tax=Rhizohabitans arisaemae TaxID=2720610 RepID=UPI0024B0BD68|nr:BTAD domain-containing putative transcriptional regulator [Rhizohabitans arisaemae]
MRFGVLGPLEVRTDDGVPVRIPETKVRLLLADLLSHDGRPVPVDRLAEDLWGGRPPRDPGAVLRTKISHLRRAFDLAEPGGRELVTWQPAGYALDVTDDSVDARRFDRLLARARIGGDTTARAALLAEALRLWRGQAFAGLGDRTFLQAAIAGLEERRLAALEEYAEAELELGRHRGLLDVLTDLVREHPLRERLQAAHMRALYLAGRQSEAIDAYLGLRERLADELGVDPSPELAAVHRAVVGQDPALGAPGGRRRGNLPAPLTEPIGRDEAVTHLAGLLRAHRLVTLTGPGGVGKTRLALAAAERLGDDFPDGVWFAELAVLNHPARTGSSPGPAAVATRVAAALGLGESTVPGPQGRPVPLSDRVAAAVRGRRMLLILDNCEHVVDAAAEVAVRLLTGAAGLRVLATSREPLSVSGERLHVVGPLGVPETGADAETVARADAVRLFTARAAAAGGGFALDADNAETVATICRRLDGLPLALELAAARVRSLGAGEVARRLDARFRLLTAGPRDAPARQRTLRAVIDWSWELLSEQERAVLCALALHPGGCALDTAEALSPAADVVDVLDALVAKSLVARAGDRYRLAESVAAYCVERLAESGRLEDARRLRDEHYAALARRADVGLRGADQPRWLRVLDVESANLDAVIRSADAAPARRLALSLAWYWLLRGRTQQAVQAFTHLADSADPEVSTWRTAFAWMLGQRGESADRTGEIPGPLERARARWVLGAGLFGVGEPARSERLVEQALAGFQAHGDRWGAAAALNTLAWHALDRGDHHTGGALAERSHTAFTELGDPWGVMVATESLASAAEATGGYRRAAALYRRSLEAAEELGLSAEIPFKLCGLAGVHLATGEIAEAESHYARAARIASEQSIWLAETYASLGLARVARLSGRLDLARERLRPLIDWHHRHGYEDRVAADILAESG